MMLRTGTVRPRGRGHAVLAVLSLLTAGAARGEDLPARANVITAGPWLLAPSLTAGWSNDSNVFYRSSASNPEPENVFHVMPEVKALLPFRNSEFEGRYRRDFVDYEKSQLEGAGYQEYAAALRLRFSTHDTLEVTGALTRGQADALRFDSGELVFQGENYRLNAWGMELSRDVLGHRGYSLRAQRVDLNFEHDTDVRFFDFRANSVEGEYREPVRPKLSILTTVRLESGDHFCRDVTPLGDLCPAVGEPFRTEESGMVLFGVRGALPGDEPFFLRLGREVRRYASPVRVDHDVVGDGHLTLRLTPSTRLYLDGNRGLWSSFFLDNDFYRAQGLEARVERVGARRSTFGASLGWQAMDYARGLAAGARRRDRTVRTQAYATLIVRERAGLRLSVEKHRRSSNLEGFDYDGTVFFAGMVLGWF
ncbi:MAG TPA: hypothetical protein VFV75_09290 [Candidatus Polarisedimenticolaceae bacterium]|nr:hypothetical protein [Candidatus Polarisedimenticolaceae bacterium]